jgi:prepilin-type N-terminal cleavage/methylation domain-containing protein
MNIANCRLLIADCRNPGGRRLARINAPRRGPGAPAARRVSNWQSAIGNRQSHAAFTLLEILVVVAIMAIVMTIGIPFMRTAIDSPKGMKGAIKAIDDACKVARAFAILQQTTTELRIHDDGTIEMSVVGDGGASRQSYSGAPAGQPSGSEERRSSKGSTQGGGPWKLPDGVGIEAILANGLDVTDLEVARVQFRANGTCDELQLVLYQPESGTKRMVWLDVVTATVDFETDERKFKIQ